MITAVAGPCGVGKTTWIREQIARGEKVLYFCPGSDTLPIDPTWISANFPQVQILKVGEESQLLELAENAVAYIELGFHLDFEAIAPVLERYQCDRVAIVPQGVENSPWEDWSDRVVFVPRSELSGEKLEMVRGVLTGEILDPPSLEVFWYELTHGAYGKVSRVKGIFELADGQCIAGNFVADGMAVDFQALDLPLWLDGRPDRFSGIEVVGEGLDREAIVSTLQDFCLSDAAIAYSQEQIKENLQLPQEVT
ncbi:GTP-binding protein [Phormidium sp. CCY1219]|uniref:GTP-binding protein n=1 Tax=Phormidium sp. CCY1219 TaxID=2886104 RepID=UPI002D1E689E|nr:GTP-binding protein [Phormidium sp. CCY1219]MEB3831824.1 GTP-binding protein [Phormidium sp. CCY1219]